MTDGVVDAVADGVVDAVAGGVIDGVSDGLVDVVVADVVGEVVDGVTIAGKGNTFYNYVLIMYGKMLNSSTPLPTQRK